MKINFNNNLLWEMQNVHYFGENNTMIEINEDSDVLTLRDINDYYSKKYFIYRAALYILETSN